MLMMSIDQVFEAEGSFRMQLIDQRSLPEDIVGDEEVMRMLNREIRGVPPLLREVLVMRDLSQMPLGDIAAQLEISVPAVKSRVFAPSKVPVKSILPAPAPVVSATFAPKVVAPMSVMF